MTNHSDFNYTLWAQECLLSLDFTARHVTIFLLYLIIFMVGLLENLLVLWVNWRRRHSANGVLFCIINMSVSDLMMVSVMPFFMIEATMDHVWVWGKFLCKFTNLIQSVNFFTSTFFLALMTLERYLSLAKPTFPALFPVMGHRRWLLCGGVWVFSLFLGLLENWHQDLGEWEDPICYMMPEHDFMEWFISLSFIKILFQFVGPASIIVTCNILIARAVKTAPDVQGRRDVWLVHAYTLVFMACWLPYHLVLFLVNLEDITGELLHCRMLDFLYFSYALTQTMTLFHAVANPILYNFLSKSFRNNLINNVLTMIPRAEGGAAGDQANRGGGADPKKQRKLSNSSTSQSDVGS